MPGWRHPGRGWMCQTEYRGDRFTVVQKAEGLQNNNLPLWPVSDRASFGDFFLTGP